MIESMYTPKESGKSEKEENIQWIKYQVSVQGSTFHFLRSSFFLLMGVLFSQIKKNIIKHWRCLCYNLWLLNVVKKA